MLAAATQRESAWDSQQTKTHTGRAASHMCASVKAGWLLACKHMLCLCAHIPYLHPNSLSSAAFSRTPRRERAAVHLENAHSFQRTNAVRLSPSLSVNCSRMCSSASVTERTSPQCATALTCGGNSPCLISNADRNSRRNMRASAEPS